MLSISILLTLQTWTVNSYSGKSIFFWNILRCSLEWRMLETIRPKLPPNSLWNECQVAKLLRIIISPQRQTKLLLSLLRRHVCPIQKFDKEFYSQFQIFIAGLDNIEARRWLNFMAHSLVEFEKGEPKPETVRPLIDGGTEGFRGQARVIWPYKTACFECTLGSLPPQV